MRKAPIRRIAEVGAIPADLRGGVVAIGNFDGVHRGHQAVLSAAAGVADALGAPLLCLTFEPHPRTVFAPQSPVPRLTPAPMKAKLLQALGFDAVVEQPFDRSFAALAAEDFVDRILVGLAGARHVVVGFDFQFGARRAGTCDFLIAEGARKGFGVTRVEALGDGSGEAISSSRIRDLLRGGAAEGAAALLGYRWTVEGEIVGGQKLGRTLGYPTANMALASDDLLMHGIYAVRLRRADGSLFDGVASYGRRPTFDNGAALFETFVFDFSGDLYGETVDVSLFSFLRGEARFASAEELVRQMDRDAAAAKALLRDAEPLSGLDAAVAF